LAGTHEENEYDEDMIVPILAGKARFEILDKFSWFGSLVGFASAHGGFPVIPSFHVMRVFLAVDVHSAMCTFRKLSWYQPVYIYDQ
jgi:hypothetical protein